MIQIFSNSLGDEELQAVQKVFASKWTGYAEESKQFETELARQFGAEFVLTMSCCSAALFLSMRILGIRPGDEVIMPSINFIACANAVLDVGAKPVFADVDPEYLNVLPTEIERLRSPRTRAVILLHYGGHPADMTQVWAASEGLFIIEDSANSILSKYQRRNCGTLGDVGCFSFDSMKILCTGDGGAMIVKSRELYERAQAYRYLGLSPKGSSGIDSLKEKRERWWEINLNCISNRFLMNDVSSAIGRVQLRKLEGFIRRRKEIWRYYQKRFSEVQFLQPPPEPLPDTEGSYYLYWLRIKNGDRDRFAQYLVSKGIYCTFRYFPLHMIEHYDSGAELKNSEEAAESMINIPLHQNLTDVELEYITETVRSFR